MTIIGMMIELYHRKRKEILAIKSDMVKLDLLLELKQLPKISQKHPTKDDLDAWVELVRKEVNKHYANYLSPLVTVIKHLIAIRHLPHANIESAISSIEQQEIDRLDRLRNIPNTMMLYGMVGTVMGLITTLIFISIADNQLLSIVSAMGLAFSTTLVGVLFSVTFSKLIHDSEVYQSKVLTKFEEYVYTHLVSGIFPPNALAQTDKLVAYLKQYENKFNENLSKGTEMVKKYCELLNDAHAIADKMTEMTKAAKDATITYQETNVELGRHRTLFESAYENMVNKLNKTQQENHQYMREFTKENTEQLKENTQQLSEYRTSLENAYQGMMGNLNDSQLKTQKSMNRVIIKGEKKIDGLLEKQDLSYDKMEETLNKAFNEIHTSVGRVNQLSQDLNDVRQVLREINETLSKRRGIWF